MSKRLRLPSPGTLIGAGFTLLLTWLLLVVLTVLPELQQAARPARTVAR